MVFRCDLHVNGGHRKVVLAPRPEETADHIGLKLAALLLFWAEAPIVDPSAKHPALLGQEFRPDLMGLTAAGEAGLWVECGKTSLNKLVKVPRRFPRARVVALQAGPDEARRLRRDLIEEGRDRVEVWAWPAGTFAPWRDALAERVEVFGESTGWSLNVVLNDLPVAVDLALWE